MDAIEAIRTRRSFRRYEPVPVDRGIIAEIIADAACAPWTPLSAPEPWAFNIFEGTDRIAAFGDRALAYASANRPQIAGYEWADRPDFSVFHGAPAMIVISGKTTNPLALEEATRAGQNLSISAHARGLGSCWVGSPILWLRDPAVQAELGIPEGFTPYAAFALGHPLPSPPAPTRLAPVRTVWG